MSSNAYLIREAREFQQKFSPHGWEGSLVGRLADALEAAETLAVVRNPPPEYYAETLAEAHEEVACANRRAERAEADNAALLEAVTNLVELAGCECDHSVGMACQSCMNAAVLFGEHPGKTLLAELERLRAFAGTALHLRDLYPRSRNDLEFLPDEGQKAFTAYDAALAAWEAAR